MKGTLVAVPGGIAVSRDIDIARAVNSYAIAMITMIRAVECVPEIPTVGV